VIGLYIGAWSVNVSLNLTDVLNLSLVMLLLSVCMTTLFYSIGIATGKRGITTGLGILIGAGSFLLTTFAKSVDWLKPYENISLFHYFPANDILKNGISIWDVVVLSGITAISILLAIILFRRRDVR
jgi:putative exporter of polyketide antibiotics